MNPSLSVNLKVGYQRVNRDGYLCQKLMDYFKLDYDPFFPYEDCPEKQGYAYRMKMTIFLNEDFEKKSIAMPPVKDDLTSFMEEEKKRL